MGSEMCIRDRTSREGKGEKFDARKRRLVGTSWDEHGIDSTSWASDSNPMMKS